MTTITNSTIASMQQLQTVLSAITALSLTDYRFPTPVDLDDGSIFDIVVVGCGSSGSVLCNRLTEDGKFSVACIEAGGVPPLESSYAGIFPTLVNSKYDWNMISKDDSYANQYLQNNVVEMTAGKMLGGTSGLDHVIKVMPNKFDMEIFANASGDDSFTLDNMMKYFIKSENVCDEEILSKYNSYHGTEGPLIATTERSDKNTVILDSFAELGIETIQDINPGVALGVNEPLLYIGNEKRQSAAEGYLRAAINRSNLYIQTNALVTKININDSNVATGVQILTSDGTYKTINARKEVIVSAGALKSPQLLMLSGIGEKSHLENMNITVKADLPVGNNLKDHISNVVGVAINKSNDTTTSNPTEFPVPMTTSYVSLDGTKYPTYQSINLLFGPGNDGLIQLCAYVFKYKNQICEPLYNANLNRYVLFGVVNMLRPKSNGTVSLNSNDASDSPTVNLGHLSDSDDLVVLAKSIQNFSAIVNTTYFKSVDSEIIDFSLSECEDYELYSFDYWKCYAKCLSSTMWHYSSTCAIGTVLDNNFIVKGFSNLRVVDASSMPDTVSGNIINTVYAMAEKASDIIIEKYSDN